MDFGDVVVLVKDTEFREVPARDLPGGVKLPA